MKKLFVCVLSTVLCFSLAFCASAAMLGDINGDRAVSAEDARLALRASVQLENFGADRNNAADIDLDGAVTASDARALLRVSVGLDKTDGKYYSNQFEVLCSGVSYIKARFSGSVLESTETASFGNSAYISIGSSSNSVVPSFSLLCRGIDVSGIGDIGDVDQMLSDEVSYYIIDRASKQYADVSDEVRNTVRDNPSLLPALSSAALQRALPSDIKSLSQASKARDAVFEGVSCRAYDFRTEGGTLRYYMAGKRLLGADSLNALGVRTSRTVFETVSPCVSSSYLSIPSGYTETDGSGIVRSLIRGTMWESLIK